MAMVWDEPKRATNIERHRLDFADARDRFEWNTAVIDSTYAGKGGARFKAIRWLDDRLVTLVFSPLGSEAVSAISLRRASRKERQRYDDV